MNRENEIREARIEQSDSLLVTFFELADDWRLDVDQQRVLLGEEVIMRLEHQIQHNSTISLCDDALRRLVMLVGLNKKLKSLFTNDQTRCFLEEPLKGFEFKSPLDVIMSNPDEGIIAVRKYLTIRKAINLN